PAQLITCGPLTNIFLEMTFVEENQEVETFATKAPAQSLAGEALDRPLLVGDQREKFFMIHGPEKVSEIRVHDPLRPALNLFPNLAPRLLRRSPSPISEAGIIEYRLKDWLPPIEQRLLTYPT